MLWDASSINGYAIEASDGGLGALATCSSRMLAGYSMAGGRHRELALRTQSPIASSALGQPDPALRQFPVKLICNRSRTARISTRICLCRGGWRPTSSTVMGGALLGRGPHSNEQRHGDSSCRTPLLVWSNASDPGGADSQPNGGDPHLRSIAAMTGYHIHASDGEIVMSRTSSWTLLLENTLHHG